MLAPSREDPGDALGAAHGCPSSAVPRAVALGPSWWQASAQAPGSTVSWLPFPGATLPQGGATRGAQEPRGIRRARSPDTTVPCLPHPTPLLLSSLPEPWGCLGPAGDPCGDIAISWDTGLPQREVGREAILSHVSDRSLNKSEKVQWGSLMSHATLTGSRLQDSRGAQELGRFQRIRTTQVSAPSPPPKNLFSRSKIPNWFSFLKLPWTLFFATWRNCSSFECKSRGVAGGHAPLEEQASSPYYENEIVRTSCFPVQNLCALKNKPSHGP